MLGNSWEHFGPLCLVLILGSQALNRRAQRIRWRNEVRGLRTSLRVNLHSLRILYSDNLRAVVQDKPPLVSGRHQINLLKTQLSRLSSLDEPEVETVMLACIAVERAESVLGAAGKALSRAGVAVHRRDEKRAMAESALQAACSMLETAEKLLGASADGSGDGKAGTQIESGSAEERPLTEQDARGAVKSSSALT